MKYSERFNRLVKVKYVKGDQIIGHCPFHKDKNPSFSANTRTGLWICFAGCGQGSWKQFVEKLKGGGFYGKEN